MRNLGKLANSLWIMLNANVQQITWHAAQLYEQTVQENSASGFTVSETLV